MTNDYEDPPISPWTWVWFFALMVVLATVARELMTHAPTVQP